MKILVVGGAGYLGGAITDYLINTNHNILVYDNLLYEDIYRKNIPFIYGDIRDHKKLKKYLKWADKIIWIAALVGDQACNLDQPVTKEINTDSIRFLAKNFNKKILYTSTCSCYGVGKNILTEKSKLNPLSHYAVTKLWGEQELKNKNALIFRLGTLFGISDNFSRFRTDLVLNTLVLNAHARGKLNVFGGDQYRPLIHVKDVAKIICDNINSKEIGIFNLHKTNITIIDLAYIIKTHFPKLKLKITETTFEDSRNYKVSSDKAKSLLKITPSITINQGIKEIKKLLDEKRIKNPFNNRYSNYKYLNQIFKGEIK